MRKGLFVGLIGLVCMVLFGFGQPVIAGDVEAGAGAGGEAHSTYSGHGYNFSNGQSESIVYAPSTNTFVSEYDYDVRGYEMEGMSAYGMSSQSVESSSELCGIGRTRAWGQANQGSFVQGLFETDNGGGYFFVEQDTHASYSATDWGRNPNSAGSANVYGLTLGGVSQFEFDNTLTTSGYAIALGYGDARANCHRFDTDVWGSGHVGVEVGHTVETDTGYLSGVAGGSAQYNFHNDGKNCASGMGTAYTMENVKTWQENDDYYSQSNSYSYSSSGMTHVDGQSHVGNSDYSYSSNQ